MANMDARDVDDDCTVDDCDNVTPATREWVARHTWLVMQMIPTNPFRTVPVDALSGLMASHVANMPRSAFGRCSWDLCEGQWSRRCGRAVRRW